MQQSLQNSACLGQHQGDLPKIKNRKSKIANPFGVVADKECTCPASKLMWEHYPPTPPFHCGENEIQASLISSASVGATPTPATNLGRCSGCRPVNPVSLTIVGSDDWSITSTSHHFGSVAQLAERPVVCGRVEGASPFGSAIPSERSSVFRAPGLGPGGRRRKSCRSDHFQIAAVVEYMRHPSSKRNDAGGNPVGSAIAR